MSTIEKRIFLESSLVVGSPALGHLYLVERDVLIDDQGVVHNDYHPLATDDYDADQHVARRAE